jgi:glycosyltransferase involved in cell wall biosynthesis
MEKFMKKISVVVPTFNEEENVVPISEAIIHELDIFKARYTYELIFIDNDSRDSTRDKLRSLCKNNANIKAIFNAKNFGQFNSPYYGLCQATGDAVILMVADFQDPVEFIPKMIKGWEDGFKIVSMIKIKSKENPILFFLRSIYYKLIKRMSDVEQIEHFTGFGLYDKSFIQVLRELDDPKPFLRGIVAELGYKRLNIPYIQAKRRSGKTSNNWYRLYDGAMLSFTSYTKIGLRIATIFGFFVSLFSIIIAFIYLILKLIYWDRFPAGNAPILIGMFVLGGIQLFFIGLLGEYILNMNDRIMKRPLVVEEERLNFT